MNDADDPQADQAAAGEPWVLVLPDRDAAEAVAQQLRDEHPPSEPTLHREALAGEDDAEDAQWLVVLPPSAAAPLAPAALDALAAEHDGWLEGYAVEE